MTTLSQQDVTQWREQGYCLVEGLNVDGIQEGVATMGDAFPQSGPKPGKHVEDFGSGGKAMFPSKSMPFVNTITTSPALLTAVEQLLGTEDIVLIQSTAWAKYGKKLGPDGNNDDHSNNDQRVHMDYGNNMWVHPPPWDQPNAVSIIIYLSDVRQTGGGTAVTPRQGDEDLLYQWPYSHMPGIGGIPFKNNKAAVEAMMREGASQETIKIREECYRREIKTRPKFGSVLFYRHDVWHRGTPVDPGQVRYVMNVAWAKKNSPGMSTWNQGLTIQMYYGWLEEFVRSLNGQQLRSLGFPARSNPYWTKKTIEAVNMRYRTDIVSKL